MLENVDPGRVVPWILAILAGLWAILLKFGNRELRVYDRSLQRLDDLEKTAVTQEELDAMLDKLEKIRRELHEENKNQLSRIEGKIDTNEARDSATRHDIRDEVHAISIRLAVIETKVDDLE